MPAPSSEITAFLKKFKQNLNRNYTFIERKKNLDALASLGLNFKNVRELLSQLTYRDYVKGPKEDRDREGFNIWEFGMRVQGEDLYIKLSDDFRCDTAKCISFHIAKYPIRYPHKD